MDTRFFDQALAQYRASTGDTRNFADLPVDAQSRVMSSAAHLKDFVAKFPAKEE